jgi:hypothetical protein
LEKEKCSKSSVNDYLCDLLKKLVFLKKECPTSEDKISISSTNDEINSLTESLLTLSTSTISSSDSSSTTNDELNFKIKLKDKNKLSFEIEILSCDSNETSSQTPSGSATKISEDSDETVILKKLFAFLFRNICILKIIREYTTQFVL